jgi:GxxExxY protein
MTARLKYEESVIRTMNVETELREAVAAVHDELGGGYSESVYHRALETELSNRGVTFSSEGSIPIFYDGSPVGRRRPDLFVRDGDETLVLELKAGSNRGEAQLLQYLDLLGEDDNFNIQKGLLVQFNDNAEIEEKNI